MRFRDIASSCCPLLSPPCLSSRLFPRRPAGQTRGPQGLPVSRSPTLPKRTARQERLSDYQRRPDRRLQENRMKLATLLCCLLLCVTIGAACGSIGTEAASTAGPGPGARATRRALQGLLPVLAALFLALAAAAGPGGGAARS